MERNEIGGQGLRKLREELDMTREEAAIQFNVSPQSIYNYEQGYYTNKAHYVQALVSYVTDFRIALGKIEGSASDLPMTPSVLLGVYRNAKRVVDELERILRSRFDSSLLNKE